jgi:cellulose synthase/poly-beta-1,6-N-acetylglucosamine synthase-like glycosyltransferase
MTEPFVSVIVPVFNGASFVETCIAGLVGQNYPKERYEVIVVDNNSTDNTANIIKRYPVTYALEDCVQTSYAARNKGIDSALGDILAFTDADCIADQKWILNGVKPFANRRIGGVGGKVEAYKPSNYIERYQARMDVFGQDRHLNGSKLSQREGKIVTCNAFYRKNVFEKIGLFNPALVSGGDHDFSLRVQKETDYALQYAPDAVVYHQHRSSLVQFWKQYYKYGQGRIYLAKNHKQEEFSKRIRYGYARQIYWYLKSIRSAKQETVSSASAASGAGKENHIRKLQETFLLTVAKLAFLCGSAESAYKNRTPYFDTIF